MQIQKEIFLKVQARGFVKARQISQRNTASNRSKRKQSQWNVKKIIYNWRSSKSFLKTTISNFGTCLKERIKHQIKF